jgi:mRNA-degrading endonuclease YafQ of YafQ-DinJ toxin-antitoxin module
VSSKKAVEKKEKVKLPLSSEYTSEFKKDIGGDFLLIYQKTDNAIVFARTGSHADLFEN